MSALRKAEISPVTRSAGAEDSLQGESVSIGPMRITTLSGSQLTERLIEHAIHGRSTHHVVTANAQFYVLAERDRAFQECVMHAEYVCADGLPIVRLCHWLGATGVERVTGVDLIPSLCEQAAAYGLPVYLLGGNPGSAATAASKLMDLFPTLHVSGVGCPPYGFERSPDVLEDVLDSIRVARPAIVFVALGAPKQEFFIQQHLRRMGIPVAVGVGGSFEFLAGERLRAPEWVQTAGLEWAFRFMQEPRRLARRYIVGNSIFSCYVLRFLMRRVGESITAEPAAFDQPREKVSVRGKEAS